MNAKKHDSNNAWKRRLSPRHEFASARRIFLRTTVSRTPSHSIENSRVNIDEAVIAEEIAEDM